MMLSTALDKAAELPIQALEGRSERGGGQDEPSVSLRDDDMYVANSTPVDDFLHLAVLLPGPRFSELTS